jgi:hypothetical protein
MGYYDTFEVCPYQRLSLSEARWFLREASTDPTHIRNPEKPDCKHYPGSPDCRKNVDTYWRKSSHSSPRLLVSQEVLLIEVKVASCADHVAIMSTYFSEERAKECFKRLEIPLCTHNSINSKADSLIYRPLDSSGMATLFEARYRRCEATSAQIRCELSTTANKRKLGVNRPCAFTSRLSGTLDVSTVQAILLGKCTPYTDMLAIGRDDSGKILWIFLHTNVRNRASSQISSKTNNQKSSQTWRLRGSHNAL